MDCSIAVIQPSSTDVRVTKPQTNRVKVHVPTTEVSFCSRACAYRELNGNPENYHSIESVETIINYDPFH